MAPSQILVHSWGGGGKGQNKDFSADLQMDLTVRGLVYLWHRL